MVPNCLLAVTASIAEKPNFVVIFIDDMGYEDIEPFGSTINSTRHFNKMAEKGSKEPVYRFLNGERDTQFKTAVKMSEYLNLVQVPRERG